MMNKTVSVTIETPVVTHHAQVAWLLLPSHPRPLRVVGFYEDSQGTGYECIVSTDRCGQHVLLDVDLHHDMELFLADADSAGFESEVEDLPGVLELEA